MNGDDTQPIWKYLKENAETPVQDIDWVSAGAGVGVGTGMGMGTGADASAGSGNGPQTGGGWSVVVDTRPNSLILSVCSARRCNGDAVDSPLDGARQDGRARGR